MSCMMIERLENLIESKLPQTIVTVSRNAVSLRSSDLDKTRTSTGVYYKLKRVTNSTSSLASTTNGK